MLSYAKTEWSAGGQAVRGYSNRIAFVPPHLEGCRRRAGNALQGGFLPTFPKMLRELCELNKIREWCLTSHGRCVSTVIADRQDSSVSRIGKMYVDRLRWQQSLGNTLLQPYCLYRFGTFLGSKTICSNSSLVKMLLPRSGGSNFQKGTTRDTWCHELKGLISEVDIFKAWSGLISWSSELFLYT